MKKILLLATFVVAAFTANAQCSGAKAAATSGTDAKPKACCASKTAGTCSKGTASADAAAKPVNVLVDQAAASETAVPMEAKKTCTASQAKTCTKEEMKKGCCSKKTAAVTEEKTEAAPVKTTGTN